MAHIYSYHDISGINLQKQIIYVSATRCSNYSLQVTSSVLSLARPTNLPMKC